MLLKGGSRARSLDSGLNDPEAVYWLSQIAGWIGKSEFELLLRDHKVAESRIYDKGAVLSLQILMVDQLVRALISEILSAQAAAVSA